jgi:predicted RNA-binding protein (virulence factor B family)
MIKIGDYNKLKVVRESKIGYYLDAETGNTSDDILLPIKSALGKELSIGDEVEAFIYKDSQDRTIATLKEPLAKVGDLAYLEVVDKTKIGYFVDFGLERDILVPFKEENYFLQVGKKYLFYIYLDKTDRLAGTTYIDKHLHDTDTYDIDQEVYGTVYGIQENGTLMVAVDNLYRGVILKKEYYNEIKPGDVVKVRVKKYYEDGKLDLTVRKERLAEMNDVEEKVLSYLKEHDGFMPYNDKSSPEDIKEVFETSKNAFKRALGGLMKKGLITQDSRGTTLK